MICSSLRLKLALQVVPLALPGGLFSLTFFFARPPHAADGSRVGGFFLPFFWPFRHSENRKKQLNLSFRLIRSLASLSLIDRSKRKSFGSSSYAQEYGQNQGYMFTVAILAQGK